MVELNRQGEMREMGSQQNIVNRETIKIHPSYFVIDESFSMAGEKMVEVNDSVRSIHEDLRGDPVASAQLWLSFIGFSEDAQLHLELTDYGQYIQSDKKMFEAVGRQTNFGAAFTLLKERIDVDLQNLRSQGYKYSRPIVFFITDGQSSDHYQPALNRLMSEDYWPYILAFGIGEDVNLETLTKISNLKNGVYVPRQGESTNKVGTTALADIFNGALTYLLKTLTHVPGTKVELPKNDSLDQFDGTISHDDIS